jgi:threonine/homoserine/homoserine lactone efflux protein
VGITIINPLTVVYFTAFIIGRDAAAARFSLAANLLFILGVGLSSLSWQTLLAALGGIAGNRLSPRFQLLTTVLGNLLVVALGLRILWSAIS